MTNPTGRAERRSGKERRRTRRVSRCPSCQAHLIIERRGNRVQIFAAATYLLLDTLDTGSAPPPPRCPSCEVPLRAPRRS